MSTPKVFISATTGDLRSIRQIVKEALLTINCHPVEQTNFEPDARTLEQLDRQKLEHCQALIHLVGFRYGAEPDPAKLPADAPRRSYTQMEYHEGRRLQAERGDEGFRVYVFLCPETFPFDAEPDTEPPILRDHQLAHRQLIASESHRYEIPASKEELVARVHALREEVLLLKREQKAVGHEVRGARRSILGVLALVILLLAGVIGGVVWMKQDTGSLLAGQKFDAPRIRAHFVESTERQRDADLAAADKATKSDERQRLRETALAAHTARLARIDDAVARFAELEGGPEATRIGRELTRILTEEGTDAALAFIGREKAGLLAEADAQLAADRERLRGRLAPLLSAADLLVTKGDTAAARTAYRELLQRDPTWPAALGAFAWFLFDQSYQNLDHRTVVAALADAEEAHTLATRWHEAAPADAEARRLLSATHNQMGDVLIIRGQPGDAAQVEPHYTRCNELLEKLLADNPGSAQAVRDVSISLEKLGDFLAKRAQPGDADKALGHFTRSLDLREKLLADNPGSAQAVRDYIIVLDHMAQMASDKGDSDKALEYLTKANATMEKLLADNPGSAQAVRDVYVSLWRVGDFLAQRSQPGDADKALGYFTRNLEITEKLLADNPGSAQAVRDVSISLEKLGDFLAQRGQRGDAEKALGYFTRDLALSEKLLADNPGSAQAVRDVWVSWWRIARHAETTGKGDAKAAWRKAHDILDGMVRQGMFVSPGDLEFLETLRAKVK